MLNISENRVRENIESGNYKSLQRSKSHKSVRKAGRTLIGLLFGFLAFSFLPWTQNVKGYGKVTALRPEQRPQTLQSPIPGRIAQWMVREGDTVKQGDTLVFITEVKDEYFDPALLSRIDQQVVAKEQSLDAYQDKIDALNQQIIALEKAQKLKLRQLLFALESDSADLSAAQVQLRLSAIQLQRADSLFKEGIRSRFDYEQRLQKQQEAAAKATSARNKWMKTRADLLLNEAEFAEKIAKTESDLMSAYSAKLQAEVDLAQTRVKRSSVEVRQGFYSVRAPQDGLVTRVIHTGLGENIKEGEALMELMPLDYELAVEIFIRPVDLPLIRTGQSARVEFDGWPALVFSGWPNVSFGTFGAEVVAIDNVLDPNGRYRLLLRDPSGGNHWPEQLRFGAGANGMLLLQDVPIWYEVWRQINGFPPLYYQSPVPDTDKKK